MRKRSFVLAAGACLATAALTVGTAVADPSGPPPFRPLAGTGAQTTQGVMNGMSEVIKDAGGNKIIASYDNAGSAQITTKDPAVNPNCTINRPNQGGAGINALVASLQANNGCLQFARAVTNDSASRAGQGLTYIPFAVDALTYAVRDDSLIPRDLSIADLTAIYNCQVPGIKPLLGTFGAGNRTFFLQKLGLTDSADFVQKPGHTCVKDTDVNGNPLLANNGTLLTDPAQIVTYSSNEWVAQVDGVVPDLHGKTLLGSVNGISPVLLNNDSVMSRDVYNVVPTSQLGVAPTSTVFVGPNSAVCSNAATIKRYGFNVNPKCGDTTVKTP